MKMSQFNFPIIIEKDEDGFYVASTPVISGCYTQGKTYKQALERIREAISLHLETRQIKIDFLPQSQLKV